MFKFAHVCEPFVNPFVDILCSSLCTSTCQTAVSNKMNPSFSIHLWVAQNIQHYIKCKTKQWWERKRKWAQHFPKLQSFGMPDQQIWEKLEAFQSCFCWYCLSSEEKQRIRELHCSAFGKSKDMGSESIVILKQRWFRWNTANPCYYYLQKPVPTSQDQPCFKSWF